MPVRHYFMHWQYRVNKVGEVFHLSELTFWGESFKGFNTEKYLCFVRARTLSLCSRIPAEFLVNIKKHMNERKNYEIHL